ncbi:MAG: V-type ATP synthase subunit E family protein [Acutalibacteraceae bacterium]|nr:V-type ATP synthase subunit E family protein [Acutalibacteraceae bacterium]
MANDKPANTGLSENESKFLAAIEKYAHQQRDALLSETELFEKQVLKKAEEEGLRDAYNLIHREQDAMRSSIAAEMAKKEAKGNLEIFKKRQQITEEVFAKATAKLQEYTKTPKYEEKLTAYTKECAEYFGNATVEICLCKRDMKFAEKLSKIFSGECTVKEVADINVGGLRVYCPDKQIAIDKTLDTKLDEQREWFYTNSSLQVK